MENIVTEMKLFFGSGIHVLQEKAYEIIDNSNFSEYEKDTYKLFLEVINLMGYQKLQEHLIINCGLDARETKKILEDFE